MTRSQHDDIHRCSRCRFLEPGPACTENTQQRPELGHALRTTHRPQTTLKTNKRPQDIRIREAWTRPARIGHQCPLIPQTEPGTLRTRPVGTHLSNQGAPPGLYTRDLRSSYLQGANRFSVRQCVKDLLDCQVSSRSIADEGVTDGRLICRIFGKQISQALEILNTPHRRETSLEVTRRRLLSLDFVLNHLELTWMLTQQEKVSCIE